MAKDTAPAAAKSSEQVERIFYEHTSVLVPSIIIACAILLVTIAAAVVVKKWFIAPVGLLAFLLVYFKNKKRNRFIITNTRFIRELFNPHHSLLAVPLPAIVDVRILNRATDKVGTVRIETEPRYGDQLLIDERREVGIVICRKIPGHANFREILVDSVMSAGGPTIGPQIPPHLKETKDQPAKTG